MALTKVSFSMIDGEVVNVLDFGAVGDGVADDTIALQAALTYAGTLGNAGVYLPPGIYLFTSTLTLPSGVRLFGQGSERGVGGLKSNVIGAPSINVANGYYQKIENLNLFHASPGSAGTAIQVIDNDGSGSGTDPAQYFRVKNVRVTEHATGVRIANDSTWCVFEDMTVEQCSSVAFSVTNANLTVFNRCVADLNTSAWYLENTLKTILNACTAQTCTSTTTAAINVLNCSGVEINHLWTERNEFHNVHLRGTSRMTRIYEPLNQGAGFVSGVGRGIFVDGTCSNTIIDGGWHGNNATEDITIGVTTTKNTLINPRSTTTLTFTDASGTALFISKNMNGVSGISGTSTQANNLRGAAVIADTATSASITFPTSELDTSYFVVVSVQNSSGTPASGSTRAYVSSRTTAGFSVNVEVAPGVGNSVTVAWHLIR